MTEDPIDQRLRAALRHAPDSDVGPPTALDWRIKAAARQALSTQRALAPQRGSWRDWIGRLPQPPAAAALATLALGTVIGVMWQGEVPPESMPGAPSASADQPAVVARTSPETSPAPPPQVSASVPPQVSASVPPLASPAVLPQASPKPAAPAPAPAPAFPPKAVGEAKMAAPVEQRNASPPAQPATPAATTVAAPTPPLAPAPPAAAEPARTSAENEVAGLVSPPAAPPPSEPAAAAAAPRTAAQAPPAAKLRSESRAAADSTPLPDRLGASAAPPLPPLPPPLLPPLLAPLLPPPPSPPLPPPPPPLAELANAAASPWQHVASSQMPEGGTFVCDADGQVLGRRLVERDWLWWQPWINGKPAAQAQRAAARGAASGMAGSGL